MHVILHCQFVCRMTAKQLKAVFLLMLLLTGSCARGNDEDEFDDDCRRIEEQLRNPGGGWGIG